jgi:hypothetical protein
LTRRCARITLPKARAVTGFTTTQVDKSLKQVRQALTAGRLDAKMLTGHDPSRLDPREQPRVSGRVTYASLMVDGLRTLRITINFIWVYAFTGPDRPLAAIHDETAWEFPSPVNLRTADHGMWIGKVKSYFAWMDCAAAAKGLLAPAKSPADPKPAETEDPNAILEADHTLDIGDDCHWSR